MKFRPRGLRLQRAAQVRPCAGLRHAHPCGVLVMGLLGASVWAQDAPASRAYELVPVFTASTQFVDVRSRSGGASQPAELVTALGPGLLFSKRSGWLQGSVNYQMRATLRSRLSEQNRVDHSLNANLRLEAVPGWMYVDSRASVSQQNLSPFGQLSSSDSLAFNGNQREVFNVQLSPYIRGELQEWADYELRLSAGATDVRGATVGDLTTIGGSVNLSSPRRGAELGWGLVGSLDRVSFKGGRSTDNQRMIGSVNWRPDPDLALELRAGGESTNVGTVQTRSYTNWGIGLQWAPSPLTSARLTADRRYFGDSYQVDIEHRHRRSAFRFTSLRAAATAGDNQPMSLFEFYMRLFRSQEPDEQKLRIRVLQYMFDSGELGRANEIIGASFATSAVTLQQRSEIAYVYQAIRTTYTVRAFMGSTEILDGVSLQGGFAQVDQKGMDFSIAHRMTPTMTATVLGSYQRNSNQSQVAADLKSIGLNVSSVVNRYLTASAGARYALASGASNSTRETALTGSLSLRF